MRRISEQGKAQEKRGTGQGAEYRPYIQAREFNSSGTCSNPVDWKTGRTVELLSQGEAALWHILRWDDNVKDIREQFPLDIQETLQIAEQCGIVHPGNGEHRMTTDFLVDYQNGQQKAYAMKSSRKSLENQRTVEKLYIEKIYWNRMGIEYELVFKQDLNMVLYHNIRMVVEYYDASKVHDAASIIKHLVARKQIRIDMEHKPINVRRLLEQYQAEVGQWTKFE